MRMHYTTAATQAEDNQSVADLNRIRLEDREPFPGHDKA
jgi:hypothetical protein